MRKLFNILLVLTLTLALATTLSCSGHKGAEPPKRDSDSLAFVDSTTIYGLACEGCSDSAVWLLPTDVSDPIRYDIVAAMKRHKIFGHLKTGDYIAVVVNKEDSTVADIVIDVDQLKGTWCYKVMPTLRRGSTLPERIQKMMIDSMPDSIKNIYYKPMEYGVILKRNDIASPVGTAVVSLTEEEEEGNPFVYPMEDHYVAWHIVNGQLVLRQQQAAHMVMERDTSATDAADEEKAVRIEARVVNDTADILLLTEDSLALQFKDHVQGYYHKQGIE